MSGSRCISTWAFIAACKRFEGRRTQRVRSILRHLRLWPKPAFNCCTPVRILVNALFEEEALTGETPDALIDELKSQG